MGENETKLKKMAPIIMGSPRDYEHATKIFPGLEKFGIDYDLRVISAHREPGRVDAVLGGTIQ